MRKECSTLIDMVCDCFKVVQILFKEKLRELSGNAQRSLIQVIGQMIEIGRRLSHRTVSLHLLFSFS